MKKGICLLLAVCMLMCTAIPSMAYIYVPDPDYYHRSDEGLLPYEDVKSGAWYEDSVKFCYINETVKGMNEYTFAPMEKLTRAQFVTMLANIEGVETKEFSTDKFNDVKDTHWFYGAIAWAYENDIVSGMTEDSFEPNTYLTRAQLATVMRSYMEGKYEVEVKDDALDRFTDKPKEEYWYYDAMKYAVSARLLTGNSDGSLASADTVTRAQAVVIFRSFIINYFYGDCEHIISEATCTEPPTCSKCNMKNGLALGHRVTPKHSCNQGDSCVDCRAKVEKSNVLHNFAQANCGYPRTCHICGITRGTTVGQHQWWAATCTNPKMCKICFKTEGQSLGGHNFTQATCTKASLCTKCGTKGTDVLGHSYRNGKCTRCGLVLPYDRVVYAVKNKGRYDSGTGIITYRVSSSPAVTITYDTVTKDLNASIRVNHGNGVYSDTVLTLPTTDHTARYDYRYYYKNAHNGYDWCVKKFDAHTFNTSYKLDDLGTGWYYAPYYEMHKSNIVSNIDKLLRAIDPALSNLCGSDASEFGFLYY